jgi:hypothetical protein
MQAVAGIQLKAETLGVGKPTLAAKVWIASLSLAMTETA